MLQKHLVILTALLISVLFNSNSFCGDETRPEAVQGDTGAIDEFHGVMRPDRETRKKWEELSLTGPRSYIDPNIKPKRTTVSLLSHLQYTPSVRDQGNCGDCWVWAGTACLAIALDRQESIKDRLSVQLVNSCYTTSYACCGGWAENLANWYNTRGYCVPWSNTNAYWQDGGRQCGNGSSLVSCGSISTSPQYAISSCSASYITTHGVSQATAIANIKNVLDQGKAVWFAFYAPTVAAGNAFMNFWNNNLEYQYLGHFLDSESCGQAWDPVNGWGHAVLCYGYDDSDPSNPVWYMLNSWGTTANRSHGTFYVDMDMNYSCQMADSKYNYYWASYDVTFGGSGGSDYRVLAGGDYNGDEYADIAIFRPSTGLWSIRGVGNYYFGSSSDSPVPGDYNGDGITDIAIFRPSTGLWRYKAGGAIYHLYYGKAGDTPVPGDYNGNGTTQVGIFRASSGLWAINGMANRYFGASSDKPVPGDYTGNGTTDICIFRESSGLWSSPSAGSTYFGTTGDIPVPGDYSGYTPPAKPNWAAAIYRPSTSLWSISGYTRYYFGNSSDQPVPADYNDFYGDDIAVFRDSTGLWSVRGWTRVYHGTSGDIPVTR